MVLALVSELSDLPISPAIVATGTIGLKFDLGPLGGLAGYGAQTGKYLVSSNLVEIRVTDFVLPASNFKAAEDRILKDERGTSSSCSGRL